MLSLRLAFFDHLIDISRLAEPKGIERRGDAFWIGAGTTDATVGIRRLARWCHCSPG
jgi:aerobic carbon-monoxide dehydrogenase medium subunit